MAQTSESPEIKEIEDLPTYGEKLKNKAGITPHKYSVTKNNNHDQLRHIGEQLEYTEAHLEFIKPMTEVQDKALSDFKAIMHNMTKENGVFEKFREAFE